MGLRHLKWATVVIPAAIFIIFDYLRHFVVPFALLHRWPGFLLLWTLVAAGTLVFSQSVFAIISKLEREVRRQNRELAATASIADAMSQSLNLQQLLDISLDRILEIMAVDAGTICVLDEAKGELVHLACHGLPPEVASPLARAKLSHLPIGAQVVKTGKPVVLTDLWEEPGMAQAAKKAGFRSAVSIPLKAEGKVVGVAALVSASQRSFSVSELSILETIGGQLGMAVRNTVLFEDLVRRNRELAALSSISAAVSSSLDLNEVMVAAVDKVMGLMDTEVGEIWLLEEANRELVLAVHRGLFPESFREVDRFPVGTGFPGLVAQAGEPLVTQDLSNEAQYLRRSVKERGFQFLACLPLKSRGRVVGTMDIASPERRELSPQDLQLLDAIGNQIGVAIENAALHKQVQNLAILEERERIAREMHDGLAQVLGYINAKTSAISRYLSDGNIEDARLEVVGLRKAAREVYDDVRDAILGLRLASGGSEQLQDSLKAYIASFSALAGIPVMLEKIEDINGLLERAVEFQLLRIVQEALTNVRKHAQATQVILRAHKGANKLLLSIKDNGKGFNVASLSQEDRRHFGLQTMRERAEGAGGTLIIKSAPGSGTQVAVTMPARRRTG